MTIARHVKTIEDTVRDTVLCLEVGALQMLFCRIVAWHQTSPPRATQPSQKALELNLPYKRYVLHSLGGFGFGLVDFILVEPSFQ